MVVERIDLGKYLVTIDCVSYWVECNVEARANKRWKFYRYDTTTEYTYCASFCEAKEKLENHSNFV